MVSDKLTAILSTIVSGRKFLIDHKDRSFIKKNGSRWLNSERNFHHPFNKNIKRKNSFQLITKLIKKIKEKVNFSNIKVTFNDLTKSL